jgi:hypothetical protein
MLKTALFSLSLIAALSARAVAQERQWSLDMGEDSAYLVFGTPDSDDVGVSLWCTLHTGDITLYIAETDPNLKPGRNLSATATLDGHHFRLRGKTQANEETGSISFETTLPVTHPLFGLMQKTDRVRVHVGHEDIAFPLFDADVAGLIDACKKR